ncbi:hypothetical protein B0I21_102592 [Sphingobacterium paludis]|uniref:Uncharacterized protein n=2 Tax=Sphingobacterium paludis TaxID=1476465 RepID=A0A4R7D8L3_9SPHI|nr:hypothetical protein B0I21_102592 [Sphingobacterium paludis]
MKKTIKRALPALLLGMSMTLALCGYAKHQIRPFNALHSTIDGMIMLSDTTQAITIPKGNEFTGVLVIDDKVESNHSKIKDKEFTKKVKKMVLREKATPEDVKKYGTNALNGIMFITTK